MSYPQLDNPMLYSVLVHIDTELAAEVKKMGCPFCGGVLHSARYPRKPKGLSVPLDHEESTRPSFCCNRDGCRRRVTPPSVRFLGRKHYLGAVVVLMSAMIQGPNQRRTRELHKLIGVNRKTLLRWQIWWRETFLSSRFWKCRKGLIMPPLDLTRLCWELVRRFSAECEMVNLARLLWFLSPLSCPSAVVEAQAL